MKNDVIFIGPLADEKIVGGGNCMKNIFIIRQLRKLSVGVHPIDTNAIRASKAKAFPALWHVLTHRKSNFIVSASASGAYKLLKLLRFFRIRKVTYWVIGGDFPNLLNSGMISIKPYQNAKTIIVEGKRMMETLHLCGLNNVLPLPNFKAISYIPKKKKAAPDAPVRFVFLSRITEDKGCNYIIQAAKLLNERGLESKFVVDFYGGLNKQYKLHFLAELESLPNVEYKGFLKLLDNDENYDILASYDAMLFPTFHCGEGFAGIFIDAFMAGLPVIATDWSLNGEIISDGETGIIVANRNAEKLADAMERVILSPDIIRNMAERCQKECMNFDTDHVVTPALISRLGFR